MKICRETPDLIKIGQQYQALYWETEVSFNVVLCRMRKQNHQLGQDFYARLR
jgi:hypothetical protein